MAKRYSGSLQISVVYDDKNHYRTAVSQGGKLLWRGIVNPAPSGFGPGVGYDSSQAYDEVALSALAFADHDVGGISDEAEYDEDLTGFLIRRTPRAKASSGHATKKKGATLTRHSTAKHSTKIQVGDLVRLKGGYGGTFVVVAIEGDRAKIRSVEGYKGVGATADLSDLWKYR